MRVLLRPNLSRIDSRSSSQPIHQEGWSGPAKQRTSIFGQRMHPFAFEPGSESGGLVLSAAWRVRWEKLAMLLQKMFVLPLLIF